MLASSSDRDARVERRLKEAAYQAARTVYQEAKRKDRFHERIAKTHKRLLLQYDVPRNAVACKKAKVVVSPNLAKLSNLAYKAARALYQEAFDEMMLHRRACFKARGAMWYYQRLVPGFVPRPAPAPGSDAYMRLHEAAKPQSMAEHREGTAKRGQKRLRELQDADAEGQAGQDAAYCLGGPDALGGQAGQDAMRWLRLGLRPSSYFQPRMEREDMLPAAEMAQAEPEQAANMAQAQAEPEQNAFDVQRAENIASNKEMMYKLLS